MRRSRKFAIAAALLVPALAGGFILQSRGPGSGAVLLDQVLSLVSDRYVDTLPTDDVYEKAARGLVTELNDPYSQLFSPAELQTFNRNTGGQ